MGLTSVAETYDFIKQFHFAEGYGEDFSLLTFSDATKIRRSPDDGCIKLKRDATTQYFPTYPADPTAGDANIYFRTRTTIPLAARSLKMMEIFPEVQPDGASVYVRLYNGSNAYWWNGTAWAVPAAGEWNTEAEINAHIATFNILPNRQFAVIVNLRTTDQEITPSVSEIRVVMSVEIDYIEDIVLRSVAPALKVGINPTTNLGQIQPFATDVTTIDLDDYRKNVPYNIVGVKAVFNFDVDQSLLYNLFSSYNPTTSVITLTSALPSGSKPLVVARYEPEVVVVQHQDWYEVEKLPMILLQRIEIPTEVAYPVGYDEAVVDKGTYNAIILERPIRATFQFKLHGLTASLVDHIRLTSAVIKFFEDNEFVRSAGLDEYYRIRLVTEVRDYTGGDRSGIYSFWCDFYVYDVRMPMRSSTGKAIQQINITFETPRIDIEDPTIGGEETPEMRDARRGIMFTTHTSDGPSEWSETIEIPD